MSLHSEDQSPGRTLKTFYIDTYGCQMNVADSERMASLMRDQGLSVVEDSRDADVVLINGCSVRDKAVHKTVSALGRFEKDGRKSGRDPILGIGGCVAQMEKGTLFKNAPYLDFVFGPDAIDSLPEILHRVSHGERHVMYTEFDRTQNYSTETKVFTRKAQAFVNIMKGCDKFCSYCIVPFTRGREKSRTIDEVLDDCARLVARGVTEITLLGQNVNSFGKGNANTAAREPSVLKSPIGPVGPRAGEENFPQLLWAMERDPRLASLKRIRYTSSHPLDFSDELIDCYSSGGVTKLARHLHLPVQSGSNRVLQKMGRHHKIEHYIAQMARLRELCPDVGMSTDLIVGFPGETDSEYRETLSLLDQVQYDSVYAFMYSPRPGTRAAKTLVDDVPADVKSRRLNELLAHQKAISEKLYAARVGSVMEVMVEGPSKTQNLRDGERGTGVGQVWAGRTSCNRVVNFISESPRDFTGQFVQCKIVGSTPLSLHGEPLLDSGLAQGGIQ